MGGKSSKQTIGYKFYAGATLVIAKYVSKLLNVKIGDKLAWEGESTGGEININKELLFGTKAEGGVVGTFAFQRGQSTQMPDPYLIGRNGSQISADRGVSQLVLRQPYLGNNPYIKDVTVRAERVFELDGGEPQWYAEKAGIPNSTATSTRTYTNFVDGWTTNDADGFQVFGDGSIGNTTENANPDNSSYYGIELGAFLPTKMYCEFMIHSLGQGDPVACALQIANPSLTNHTTSVMPMTELASDALGRPSANYFSDAGGGQRIYTTGLSVGVWYSFETVLNYEDSTQQYTLKQGGTVLQTGEIPMIPQAPKRLVFQRSHNIPGTVTVASYRKVVLTGGFDAADMNPAHMLRECLTNPEWGYGYDEDDLDDASFTAAADQLYSELFGLSYFWDDDGTLDTVINKILDHIDGALYVDRQTLKWTLSLIRNDYDPDTLIELRDGVEVNSISNYKKPQFLDLVNTVIVNYYDTKNSGNGAVTLSNPALFLQQAKRIATTVDYTMCCRADLAARLVQRELDVRSNPLSSCDVLATSAAKGLRRGSVFKLTAPRFNYRETIMRVTEISYGDGRTKAIKISCVEDRFAMPSDSTIVIEPPDVETPPVPAPLDNRMIIEEPYAMLVKRLGQSVVDNELLSTPDAGYFGASAARNDGALMAFVNVDSGSGYEEVARLDFCPFGELAADVDYLDDAISIENIIDGEEITDAVLFLIDDEIMAYTPPFGTALAGVKRGLFDTIPAKHLTGAPVFFFEYWFDGATTQYADGEIINIKLLPTTPQGQLELADAPTDVFEFGGRAARPYPPGHVQVNGMSYPTAASGALELTWAHRDRKQQSDQLVDNLEGDIGPEAGTVYNVRWYLNNVLDHTDAGLTGTSVTYSPSGSGIVRVELESERDSLISFFKYELQFVYGSPLVAENDDLITTEDLQSITLE